MVMVISIMLFFVMVIVAYREWEKRQSIEPTKEKEPSQQERTYTEKASRFEMVYGGTYLNYIGIVFFITGILTYLTVTLSPRLSDGMLQCIAGISLGLIMIFAGYYLHQRNMQKFAHIIVAGGFCIAFFTVCASYFQYHLIKEWLLFISIFAIVAGSGISIFGMQGFNILNPYFCCSRLRGLPRPIQAGIFFPGG